MTEEKKKKMHPFVMVGPKTGKGWAIFIMMAVSILITISPCIEFWNRAVLFLGLPLMIWCGLFALASTLVIVNLAYKWRVF